MTLNQKVSWYLMASYQYYIKGESLLTDEEYDKICQDLLKNFDEITHPHKRMLDKEQLAAGTGYAITEYPSVVKSASQRLLKIN